MGFVGSRLQYAEVIPGCSIPLVFYHLFLLDSAFVGSRLQYAEVIPGCSIPQTIKHSRKTNNSWDYRIPHNFSLPKCIRIESNVTAYERLIQIFLESHACSLHSWFFYWSFYWRV